MECYVFFVYTLFFSSGQIMSNLIDIKDVRFIWFFRLNLVHGLIFLLALLVLHALFAFRANASLAILSRFIFASTVIDSKPLLFHLPSLPSVSHLILFSSFVVLLIFCLFNVRFLFSTFSFPPSSSFLVSFHFLLSFCARVIHSIPLANCRWWQRGSSTRTTDESWRWTERGPSRMPWLETCCTR